MDSNEDWTVGKAAHAVGCETDETTLVAPNEIAPSGEELAVVIRRPSNSPNPAAIWLRLRLWVARQTITQGNGWTQESETPWAMGQILIGFEPTLPVAS